MSDLATTVEGLPAGASLLDRKMKKSSAWVSSAVVIAALVGGLGFIGFHIAQDLGNIVVSSSKYKEAATRMKRCLVSRVLGSSMGLWPADFTTLKVWMA